MISAFLGDLKFSFKMKEFNNIITLKTMQSIGIQLGIAFCVLLGTQNSINLANLQRWSINVVKFIAYILQIKVCNFVSTLIFNAINDKVTIDVSKMIHGNKNNFLIFFAAGLILNFTGTKVLGEDFSYLLIANILYNALQMKKDPEDVLQNPPAPSQSMVVGTPSSPLITYGVGMACSYFEGYLVHILPSDGGNYGTLEEKMRVFESDNGILFPVKKLFIVITKSLFCQPELSNYDENKNKPDMPRLEVCKSFNDVKKSVAGVKGRRYSNTAYKILRGTRRPVHLAAELATPLHTLQRVLRKRAVYNELVDADSAVIVKDFCTTLMDIIQKHPETKNKVVLVHFDDTDDKQILAEVLLEKIREIEPDFERLIEEHHSLK